MLWFIRSYFGAGRRWLALAIAANWIVLVVLNVFLPFSSVFSVIDSLDRSGTFLGEPFALARGLAREWNVAAALLGGGALLAYVVDASAAVWRRGERRRALVIGGSMILFIVAASLQAGLVDNGALRMPYMVSFAFLAVVLAMGFELSADVARSVRLSRELEESEQRMQLAARAAKLGLWVWEISTDEIWTTDQGRELFGFGKEEPLDLPRFLGALHPEDREVVHGEITQSIGSGGEYESKHRVVLADGQVRWIAAFGRVEFDADRRALRMQGVSIDVTQQRRTELELQQQRGELAHLSRVAMLGELSGSLAHELNQPLAAILSNAQAAQLFLNHRGIDLPELAEILGDIVQADQRAGEVIRRLRLLLRKGEIDMQLLDVNELVREVLRLVRSDLINQNVIVQTSFADRLPAALGDSVQLQQVILNLVTNACDAMADKPPDDRRLLVRTAPAGASGLCVFIEDRGRGLPGDAATRIFQPFYTTKPHGMGLGLSVCRTILSAHGGSLGAANNTERGATFHFTLPATAPALE